MCYDLKNNPSFRNITKQLYSVIAIVASLIFAGKTILYSPGSENELLLKTVLLYSLITLSMTLVAYCLALGVIEEYKSRGVGIVKSPQEYLLVALADFRSGKIPLHSAGLHSLTQICLFLDLAADADLETIKEAAQARGLVLLCPS